jgi:hypothetical protein
MSADADSVDGPNELYEVEPREQVGAVTGLRYDFQYHQAAAAALQVLDDTDVACVYCEWHDDYVIEAAGILSYRFHQVKTRSASQGPWRVNEFFGIPGKRNGKPRTGAAADSIFARYFDHIGRFGTRCELFVFVTDAGITIEFDELLRQCHGNDSLLALSLAQQVEVGRIHASLHLTFATITANDLFAFLKRLRITPAIGSLANIQDCRTLIGGRILELSEVDLTQSQSQKIGADIVAAVRERSQRVMTALPDSVAALRAAKGLVIDDLLSLLSLSAEGYRELKAGGRTTVVALSRLQRLLRRSAIPTNAIPGLCRLKASWDAWWITQRHVLNALDVMAMKAECSWALSIHSTGNLDFNGLRSEALAIATKFGAVLTPTEPLTDELIFGLMLSLAVEAEQ